MHRTGVYLHRNVVLSIDRMEVRNPVIVVVHPERLGDPSVWKAAVADLGA